MLSNITYTAELTPPTTTFRDNRGIKDGGVRKKINVLYKKKAPLLKVVGG